MNGVECTLVLTLQCNSYVHIHDQHGNIIISRETIKSSHQVWDLRDYEQSFAAETTLLLDHDSSTELLYEISINVLMISISPGSSM